MILTQPTFSPVKFLNLEGSHPAALLPIQSLYWVGVCFTVPKPYDCFNFKHKLFMFMYRGICISTIPTSYVVRYVLAFILPSHMIPYRHPLPPPEKVFGHQKNIPKTQNLRRYSIWMPRDCFNFKDKLFNLFM